MSQAEDDQGNRFAPPRADVNDVPPDPSAGPVLAGRWLRLGGAIIDALIVMTALWVASRVTPWNPFNPANASFTRFAPTNALFGFILFVVVQGYPLATSSQTWGKKILGMKIVRGDGSPIEFTRLLGLRYGVPSLFGLMPLIAQVWSLADSLFIFRASRRCLHDSIADTIVIKI